jgi:molecular chaperone GrpE
MQMENKKENLEFENKETNSESNLNSQDNISDEVKQELKAEEVIEKLKAELAESNDKNLRLLAEMQNLRARNQKDLKDAREYAVASFAQDMILVSENINRAREAIPNSEDELFKKLVSGIDLTIEEVKKIFTKQGIERIAPNKGDKFDYNIHQAIVQVASDEFDEGCVLQLIHAGYSLKERILKPAMVVVAKKP